MLCPHCTQCSAWSMHPKYCGFKYKTFISSVLPSPGIGTGLNLSSASRFEPKYRYLSFHFLYVAYEKENIRVPTIYLYTKGLRRVLNCIILLYLGNLLVESVEFWVFQQCNCIVLIVSCKYFE